MQIMVAFISFFYLYELFHFLGHFLFVGLVQQLSCLSFLTSWEGPVGVMYTDGLSLTSPCRYFRNIYDPAVASLVSSPGFDPLLCFSAAVYTLNQSVHSPWALLYLLFCMLNNRMRYAEHILASWILLISVYFISMYILRVCTSCILCIY